MNFTNEISAATHLPAPALARGMAVLRLLEDASWLSLDRIAGQTGIPKASVLRLLQTLSGIGLVERRDRDKSYRARVRIVPLAESDSVQRRIHSSLMHLSATVGHTAEWYVPAEQGLVLVQRCEPEAEQVKVHARIGFVRAWHGELDAVACIGNALCPSHPRTHSGYWTYDAEGRKRSFASSEVRDRLQRARQTGTAADDHYNPNGVRRMAAAVSRGGALSGILALAASYRPGETHGHHAVVCQLAHEARDLSE